MGNGQFGEMLLGYFAGLYSTSFFFLGGGCFFWGYFDGREYQKERGLLLVYILYEYISGKKGRLQAGVQREEVGRRVWRYWGL